MTVATSSGAETDSTDDGLYRHLFDQAERVRWQMDDVPFHAIQRDRVTPDLVAFVRAVAISELTTFTASRKFLHEFADDLDFSQWISVWFYEETRHPQVLMRWLEHVGETIDRSEMLRGRAATPFMKSRVGTLVTNIISEMIAAAGYIGMMHRVPEPVLASITRNLAADEARHASGFYRYARRALERSTQPDADRATALKVLHLWLRDSEHVGHPVNQLQSRRRDAAADDAASKRLRQRVCDMIGTLVGVEIDRVESILDHVKRLGPAGRLGASDSE